LCANGGHGRVKDLEQPGELQVLPGPVVHEPGRGRSAGELEVTTDQPVVLGAGFAPAGPEFLQESSCRKKHPGQEVGEMRQDWDLGTHTGCTNGEGAP